MKVDKYPIPNVSDLFTQLSGGTVHTAQDMIHAYQQVVLNEEYRGIEDHGAVTAEHTYGCRLPRQHPCHRMNT